MEFVVESCKVLLEDGELQIYCRCGARAQIAQSAESGAVVFGYICSNEGHAITDFGSEADLAAFHECWRAKMTSRT